ncbi:protein FAM110B [Anguilla anguilla]|uniref:protein FAM110B n=1 Tax=Anguilla anguilla TaxID=7936 RepID=UPI0015A88DDD|nr:protein FAM110B [Anguilla anguilla]XP_035238503.1 protein FAM110B [Anguilla anguilla]XP_035238504.1 protein FAM110B [Anguilla anguilla]XP_035238505.1 protein FAM110B [Anguilla anguilla]
MPVETLLPSDGRMAGAPLASAMPFRLLNKGPEYFRRAPEPGARKPSAVERLEADKAKYVKSQQVARTKQEPVKPPIIRKPLLSPSMLLQCRINSPPARKVPRRPADSHAGPLNLEILNNLINVCEGPPPAAPACLSASKGKPPPANSSSGSSSSSSPLDKPLPDDQNRRPPPVLARAMKAGAYGSPAGGSPNTVTVRRVDVRPQAEVRKPQRMPLQPQAPKRQVAQPQAPPPPPLAPAQPAPTQPSTIPSLPSVPPSVLPPPLPQPCLPASPRLLCGMLPPGSPAFTRLSSASSRSSPRDGPGSARRHPSLHRSKSDLSDRYSRATADLERFFNYCGLDPGEVEGLGVERFARASSDIVSVSKLRSVSTPSSECGAPSQRSRAEQEEGPPSAERAPYGISVIERNARVIKWLYGIRQARDAHSVSNV